MWIFSCLLHYRRNTKKWQDSDTKTMLLPPCLAVFFCDRFLLLLFISQLFRVIYLRSFVALADLIAPSMQKSHAPGIYDSCSRTFSNFRLKTLCSLSSAPSHYTCLRPLVIAVRSHLNVSPSTSNICLFSSSHIIEPIVWPAEIENLKITKRWGLLCCSRIHVSIFSRKILLLPAIFSSFHFGICKGH